MTRYDLFSSDSGLHFTLTLHRVVSKSFLVLRFLRPLAAADGAAAAGCVLFTVGGRCGGVGGRIARWLSIDVRRRVKMLSFGRVTGRVIATQVEVAAEVQLRNVVDVRH